MAVKGIKVSLAEVKSFRDSFQSDGEDIIARLNEVKSSMDILKGTEVWNSDAARKIQSKFDSLYPKFSSMKRVLDDYVSKLDAIMDKYESTETALVGNADQYVNDWN